MKILITGAGGQLGGVLAQETVRGGHSCIGLARVDLDISAAEDVARTLEDQRPDWLVNCAAFNDVDGCEAEPGASAADRINGTAPGLLASACAVSDVRMLHISTDYVFGDWPGRPFRPDDAPQPLSAYGASKARGEAGVLDNPDAIVLRVARLYGGRGGSDILQRWLARIAASPTLQVVEDQRGNFTHVPTLARVILRLLEVAPSGGIHHWTDAGCASWYEWVRHLAHFAHHLGMMDHEPRVQPVAASVFSAPAARPANADLDTSITTAALGMQPPHWKDGLKMALDARERWMKA